MAEAGDNVIYATAHTSTETTSWSMRPASNAKRFRPKVKPENRKRVVQACAPCRRRKRKCTPGPDTSCLRCYENDFACYFEELPKQDGVSQWDDSSQTQGETQPPTTLRSHILTEMRRIHPELELEERHIDTLGVLFRLFQKPRGRLDHTPEPIPVGGDLELANYSTPRLYTSNSQILAQISRTVIEASGYQFYGNAEQSQASSDIERLTPVQVTTALVTECLAHFPAQSRAVALTSMLFDNHQSNFYYCDKDRFRRRLTALYDYSSQRPLVSPAFVCFVLITMAIASQFEHLDQASADMNNGTISDEEDRCSMPGIMYFRLSQQLLPAALEERSIETVQSCLITSFFLLATDNLDAYYMYTGLALRVSITLSLHLLKGDVGERSESAFVEESRRLFWTVYCIERRSSMTIGRPETLQLDDITTTLPQWMSELDIRDVNRADKLTAFINLTLIQNRVLKAKPYGTDSYSVEEAQALLEDWQRRLPDSCQSRTTGALRSTVHLQIMYHLTWMQLGRATLLNAVKLHLRKGTGALDSDMTPAQATLIGFCKRSANAVISSILELRDHGQIAFFSHMDFQSCSSAVTLLLLIGILETDAYSSQTMMSAFEVLGLMGEKSEYARRGTSIVRQLVNVLDSIGIGGPAKMLQHGTCPLASIASHMTAAAGSGAIAPTILGFEISQKATHQESRQPLAGATNDGLDATQASLQYPGINDYDLLTVLNPELEAWIDNYFTSDIDFFRLSSLDYV